MKKDFDIYLNKCKKLAWEAEEEIKVITEQYKNKQITEEQYNDWVWDWKSDIANYKELEEWNYIIEMPQRKHKLKWYVKMKSKS